MDRRLRSDKYLISEQPGMKILVTGLILAFFLGYTAKSFLSPARVKARLEKAASHIHKDIKVSFQGANVSLSDGIIPRFSVIITQVQMESAQACWMAPFLEVDEMRLPVSVWGLITGSSPIKTIEADNVKLTLRGTAQDCEKAKKAEAELQNAEKPQGALVSLSPSEQADKYRNAVRGLDIRSFKIVLAQYPQYQSEFVDFSARVKSFEPRVIDVKAKTNLLRDETVGDYWSHANLFLEYKDSPEETLQAHFFGNWREGHYSMIANYTIDDHLLNIETDLKHIPLSQVLSLMQKYDLVSKDLNGKQVWISAKARLTGDGEKIKEAPLEIKDFRVEGDLGEMHVDQASFTSLEPLRYKPILIDVKKMYVDKLMSFLNRSQKHRVFADMGTFTGQAEIASEKNIRLSGEHSGMQFIFSNKGQRELQVIERMSGEMSLVGDTWKIQVNRAEPRGGSFVGSLKLLADRDFKEVDLKAAIDELTLAPQVQSLMTGGGEIGVVSFNADAKLKEGKVSSLKGLAQLSTMTVEGMKFGKTKSHFDFTHGEVVLQTQVQSLAVNEVSPGGEILRQVTSPRWWSSGVLPLKDLKGEFHWKGGQSLAWKGFDSHVGKDGRLMAEGGWNEQGLLDGTVTMKEGRLTKKWHLDGNREEPTFSPESSGRMRK
ncbi:MAG: hypothetical protein J7501_11100 [Bdellovibrio sp.]|nr:hypothetical protein [Bdellovibrio sp.]